MRVPAALGMSIVTGRAMPSCPACRKRYPDEARHCPDDGSALLDDIAFSNVDPELKPGDVVGEYQIQGKIGQGAFGSVYARGAPAHRQARRAEDAAPAPLDQPDIVSRFIAEAKAVNQIRHRNIIDIFSFGILPDGRQYFLMELLEGRTLEDHFRAKGKLTLAESVPILRGIARALDAAHAKGIAHRDLKPENIFLVPDEGIYTPKLLDFGVAKLTSEEEGGFKTRTGAPIGTPYYMSPEQARGLNVDYRTDIYALGVMSHQLLTGVVPFDGTSVMDVLMQHGGKPPPRMSSVAAWVPAAVDEPVLHMLAKDPGARPQSAGAAVDALEAAARAAGLHSSPLVITGDAPNGDGQPPSSSARTHDPLSLTRRSRGSSERPSGATAAAVVGSLAAVLAVVAWVFLVRRPPPPAQPLTKPPIASASPNALVPSASPSDTTPPPPSLANIQVIATPSGATVSLVGGAVLGQAPGPFAIPVGTSTVTLSVSSPGYKTATVDVVPDAGSTVRISLKRVPAAAAPVSTDIPNF